MMFYFLTDISLCMVYDDSHYFELYCLFICAKKLVVQTHYPKLTYMCMSQDVCYRAF